jgi:hypothetical protein
MSGIAWRLPIQVWPVLYDFSVFRHCLTLESSLFVPEITIYPCLACSLAFASEDGFSTMPGDLCLDQVASRTAASCRFPLERVLSYGSDL